MSSKLDILFLTGLFPKEKEEEIMKDSKGGIQNAANNLQWELALGLKSNKEVSVEILNSLYIGSYPSRYKKMIIETYRFKEEMGDSSNLNVGYINLPLIKNYTRYYSMKKYIKSWVTGKKGRKKVVVAYAMTSTFTSLLRYAKNIDKDIVTCLIVPDLPQYMNLSGNPSLPYTILKKIEIKIIEKDMESIDSYVLLTKYMSEFLGITQPFTVIEGISTNKFLNIESVNSEERNKSILYTGGLVSNYGIIDLIDAFKRIEDSNLRLIICGAGEAKDKVIKVTQEDERIIYKGLISREEVLQLQSQSTILINPRSNDNEYTKYSFPSKIMEYMSSGRPVVSHFLDGMPEEYRNYIYIIKEDADGLYETLKDIISKPDEELTKKGFQAREFVLGNKNKEKQTTKIINMLKEV